MIDEQGGQVGVVDTREAQRMAKDKELDLVLISPNAVPPVAKILDYGKWRYEQQQAEKDARKKAKRTELKSMKLRPKIEEHDYQTKKGHIKRFLEEGHKVKVTIMFRGREMAHQELGTRVLSKLVKDLEGIGFAESRPEMLGRDMNMVMAPGNKPSVAAPVPIARPASTPSPTAPPVVPTPVVDSPAVAEPAAVSVVEKPAEVEVAKAPAKPRASARQEVAPAAAPEAKSENPTTE